MQILLLINMGLALLVLQASYGQAKFNALEFYPSTLVTMFNAAAAILTALAGLILKRLGFLFLIISSVAMAIMPISCIVSVSGYQGGDDGGSLGWAFYVGFPSLLCAAAGVVTAIIGYYVSRKSRPRSSISEASPAKPPQSPLDSSSSNQS